jgi:uncharacterized membrane protein
METRSRSLLKAVSWRILGCTDTVIIAFLVTGRLSFAATISLMELVTKTFLFYAHERAWNRLRVGRPARTDEAPLPPPDYQI